MKNSVYFDFEKFISEVLAAMRLGNVSAPVLLELREAIEKRLSDRIITTIFGSFGDLEMKLFEKLLIDHPELDEIDVLMMIVPTINGLKEKLQRNINSLYEELVYDADQIEKSMKISK